MSYTHLVSFDNKAIETTVTDRGSEVDSWVNTILAVYRGGDMIVGLDCEWSPTFLSGTSNRIATLQLCVDTKCLILQLFYMDYIPQSFKNFLSNPAVTFVGVEVESDAMKLRDEYELDCQETSNIRALACSFWPNRWYRRPGLKDLAFQIVGLLMQKPIHVCSSNWEARILSNEQVEYASIDAYASYRIGHRLLKEM